ncbi:MAG TPA: M14 family metallopeptidase [Anaerolineales bacterium]|nr:M14 family metallopeptidase [Anaerolineales bacterium]
MPHVQFDRFYRYADLTRILKAYAKEYPNLIQLETIGKSHEGREVWMVTATNFKSGKDAEKPAIWVDGNIHATEVTASAATLYLIHDLVTRYKKDETITRAMDTRAFYIVPRVNPDGAEWALADRPKFIRSSTRPYPYNEDPLDGYISGEDMDGDGRILQMRIRDSNGTWKVHPDEPRLMVRRDPIETGGVYYRILTEGQVINYDGITIKLRAPKEGLDLNRNFPASWRTASEQPGAGDYPTSEPEVLNLVKFIVGHKNITGAMSFHTFSGVLLRPYDDKPDDEFPAEDLWTYQKIGEKGTQVTGYPNISVFHEFRYHPKQVITGGFDTWVYDHLGIFSWTVEFWSPERQAGIKEYKYIDWYREHSIEDDLKLLKWNDEALEGKGHIDWYTFDHPQLGPVELGGWDIQNAWGNPPLEFLEKEIQPFPDWIVWHALIAPELAVREVTVTQLGADTYRIRLVVENKGWLPTYVTKKALERKVTRGVLAEITLPKGTSLLSGKIREELGELEGRAYKPAFLFDEDPESTHDRAKVEWVVKAKKGAQVKVTTYHERAGFCQKTIRME